MEAIKGYLGKAKERKESSIKRLNGKLEELKKFKEREDFDSLCGYITALFDLNVFNLSEYEEFIAKARGAMGFNIK